MKRRRTYREGLTLAELLMATAILAVALTGILATFVRCIELSEISKNTSLALYATKSRMELIMNEPMNQMVASYHQETFTTASVNGVGVSYIDTTNPALYQITVSFSWRQKNGLIVGEDKDLDGVIDAGEDVNGNGMLDSPVELVTSKING